MISEIYANSATISTTEYSLTNNSTTKQAITTDGVFQAFLDVNALVAGDTFEFKIYEKVQSSGTQRVIGSWIIDGAQSNPIWPSLSFLLINGWEMTLIKIAGTDRAIPWSIRQVG